jgi:hypothetical protein
MTLGKQFSRHCPTIGDITVSRSPHKNRITSFIDLLSTGPNVLHHDEMIFPLVTLCEDREGDSVERLTTHRTLTFVARPF